MIKTIYKGSDTMQIPEFDVNYWTTNQGWSLTPATPVSAPTGATHIRDPKELSSLTESQIWRDPSGSNIYKLPQVPNQLPVDSIGTGSTIENIPPPQPTTSIEGLMAATKPTADGLESLLKETQASLASQPKKDAYTQRLEETTEEFKTAGTDMREEMWERFQMQPNVEQLQKILPQMAALQAESLKLQEENRNRPISSRIIGGTADRLARQQAVEMAGLGAMAQAYQGNIEMASNLTQQAINTKYADQEMYINNLRQQIAYIEQDLNREEKVKMTQLELVINERERNIAEAKELEGHISNLMIQVAQVGADTGTLQSIMSSNNIQDAIIKAAPYLNIDMSDPIPKKIGTDNRGNDLFYDPLTKSVKTASQISAFQLGQQVGIIKGLPSYDTRAANPGVNRSDRNNNPGNIKVSDYTKEFEGVIGVESRPAEDGGHFLIFNNPEDGLKAIGRLLLEGRPYQNVTAETAIKKYNGNGSYGAVDVGLHPNMDFQKQIQDPNTRLEVARKMAMLEGWSGGLQSADLNTPIAQALGLDPQTYQLMSDTGLSDVNISNVVGIFKGERPPMTGFGLNSAEGQAVTAGLALLGYDQVKATSDWLAMTKRIATLNSADTVKLERAIMNLQGSTEQAERLYKEWQATGLPKGYAVWNMAALKAAKNMPGKAGATATALHSHILDMAAELAVVYKGGGTPTDIGLQQANESLQAFWNEEAFFKNVELIRENMQIRTNSIKNSAYIEGNLYNPEELPSGSPLGDTQVSQNDPLGILGSATQSTTQSTSVQPTDKYQQVEQFQDNLNKPNILTRFWNWLF